MATDTGAPYALRYPEDGDVADVPNDMKLLAERIELVLDMKSQRVTWTNSTGQSVPGTDTVYQQKIKIQATAPAPTDPGSEGDLIFVVP